MLLDTLAPGDGEGVGEGRGLYGLEGGKVNLGVIAREVCKGRKFAQEGPSPLVTQYSVCLNFLL